jgi:hypothetical protein
MEWIRRRLGLRSFVNAVAGREQSDCQTGLNRLAVERGGICAAWKQDNDF